MERLTEWFDDGILKGVLVKEEYGEQSIETIFEENDEGYRGMCTLKAYEDTGLTPEQIISITTELKEYKQLELSPKRLSEHVAFCRRYRELFGAIDFSRLMELNGRDTAQSPEEIRDAYGDTKLICPNCRNSVINYFNRSRPPQFCMICGQRLKWRKMKREE